MSIEVLFDTGSQGISQLGKSWNHFYGERTISTQETHSFGILLIAFNCYWFICLFLSFNANSNKSEWSWHESINMKKKQSQAHFNILVSFHFDYQLVHWIIAANFNNCWVRVFYCQFNKFLLCYYRLLFLLLVGSKINK